MPNTQLIEINFNEEVGLTLGALNEDGSPGEFEAGSQAITFTGDAYTLPNDGSDGRDIVDGVVAWFGTTTDTAEGTVTGSGDADLGSGVRTISDTTPYKAVKAGATTAVLGVFITRPKVAPTQP